MSLGLKANVDGSGAIQVGGTDAINLSTGLNATFVQNANLPNTFGFKNRIINGAMVIDQRRAGASVTPTNAQYLVDRWQANLSQTGKYSVQQNAGSVTPPAGFTNYLGVTSLSAYSVLTGDYFNVNQPIEGFNIADLAWGTASAAAVTLSFWVRSSLTGTFGGALTNGSRSYPFTYTISAANTWELETITIAGDTSGTWATTNGVGVQVTFNLGTGATYSGTAGAWAGANYASATGATSVVGTSGATFYVTGVQLEKGTTATSFDYRPYGTELQLCQRYLPAWNSAAANEIFGSGLSIATVESLITLILPVTPRARPTGLTTSAVSGFTVRNGSNVGGTATAINVGSTSSNNIYQISVSTTAGSPTLVAGQGAFLLAASGAQILLTGCEL
jgi:hypothetical protein